MLGELVEWEDGKVDGWVRVCQGVNEGMNLINKQKVNGHSHSACHLAMNKYALLVFPLAKHLKIQILLNALH